LQDLSRLDNLEPLGYDSQRLPGIGAIKNLLLREGVDGTDGIATRDETDLGVLDLPIHACLTLPDLNRLVLFKLIAQTVPRLSTGIGHCFNQMHRIFLASYGTNAKGPDDAGPCAYANAVSIKRVDVFTARRQSTSSN